MEFIRDSYLRLHLPLWKSDGATFKSDDAYGTLCTRTGAIWTPKGGYLDGIDDYYVLTNPAFTADQQGTLEMWVNRTGANNTTYFCFSKPSTSFVDEFTIQRGGGAGVEYFTLSVIQNSVTTYDLRTPAGTFDLNKYYHFVMTSNGTATLMYINGANVAITQTTGTADGVWFGDMVTDADTVTIGALRRSNTVYSCTGYIPEFRIYNRPLTLQEIQHNYLATKWRYK